MEGFDWSDLKKTGRRAVHDTFRVAATYEDETVNPAKNCRVRLHNKIGVFQDVNQAGVAHMLEGIDRIIFSSEELAVAETVGGVTYGGFVPTAGGIVTFTAYDGIQFSLSTQEPLDGPINVTWNVVRENG